MSWGLADCFRDTTFSYEVSEGVSFPPRLLRITSIDIQQSQDKKGLLTNVPCRHRREGEEKEHIIKVNFYSRKQLSLIIYKNKR